ncbi:MAG TPA: NAD(P)-dependent oxidoreductase [Acidimicrobiia bacterium]|nr:NAD(P)-dependent oxidoreductase [Acidimicrobiia bacterium]
MRVLIADSFEQSGRDALESAGFAIDYQPQLNSGDLASAVKKADVLVVRSTKVPGEVFAEPGPLGMVIRAGAGHNTIDSKAAAAHAVFVANVPGKNAVAVAELTMGLILALDRRIPENVIAARSGTWNKKEFSQSEGLLGKTLGIVGLGQIGLAVAERAVGFGLKVLALEKNRSPSTEERMQELGIGVLADLGDLLEQSHIVSLHVPGSEETRHLVDRAFLGRMRPGAILINTSRGDVIDEEALLESIDSKNLRVGLDVFAAEPGSGTGTFESPLVTHPRVYTTHHIGASTIQAQEAIAAEVVEMIMDYARGIARNVVNLTPPAPRGSLLVVRHFDRVGVLSAVLGALREAGLNVQEMKNEVFSGAGASVASIHVQGVIPDEVLESVLRNPDVIFASARDLPSS